MKAKHSAIVLISVLLLLSGCSPEGSQREDTASDIITAEQATSDSSSAEARKPLSESEKKAYRSIEQAMNFAEENNIPSENLMMLTDLVADESGHLYGIDVSHHQDDINWQEVAESGVHFVYIKASEGIDWQDPKFLENWEASRKAGLLRGAYHMFRPEDSARDQIDNFVHILSQAGMDDEMLPPVLDVEQVHTIDSVSRDELHQRINTWLEEVGRATERTPVIYTNPRFWKGYLSEDHALTSYPLWVSEYDMEASEPSSTGAWKTYALWQFSRYGIVPGVFKTVDLSRANQEFLKILE